MNDQLHEMDRLAARARLEEAPGVDGADDVIRAIRLRAEPQAPFYSPLKWVAVFSGAAAAVGFALLVWTYDSMTDPLVAAFIDSAWGLL